MPMGSEPDPGMLAAVSGGVQAADNADKTAADAQALEQEKNAVAQLWKDYETAREFDKQTRAQYALDRRYAAGTANLNFPVSANLIGAFIDILVSFLYARDPDVSVKKAERVDNLGTSDEDDFAKTMQIVVSKLWRAPTCRLKTQARSQVRSTLTTGIGWIKVIMQCNGTNIPEMQTQLNDSRDNIAELEALRDRFAQGTQVPMEDEMGLPAIDPTTGEPAMQTQPYEPAEDDEYKSQEEVDAALQKMQELQDSLSHRLEVALRKGLVVDFCSSENVQVSLDVGDMQDYGSAGWIANAIFRPTCKLKGMFPRLTDEDINEAKAYYQRKRRDLQPVSDTIALTGLAGVEYKPEEADQYVSDNPSGAQSGQQEPTFAKIVELWDRETGHVKTLIEGVKRWAKEPFQPDYPTSRFFPYFMLAFYPVDGSRQPQSLAWRLYKLMDEYSSVRSSQRLVRKRAKPGVIFNAGAVEPDDAKKIENSTEQELVGIRPTNDQPLRDLFAEKPVSIGDIRLYDTTSIVSDMERISGVQEALQQTQTMEKTATQSEIEQQGFASRTTADRDVLETMLSELAVYTSELAVGALTTQDAQRMAGVKAFWPEGMAVDDLLTMVEIEIEAGTTGKPKMSSDKEAWGVVMPQIKESILQIVQAQALGRQDIVQALTALLEETMSRMGDSTDITKFLPAAPQPMVPPVGPGGTPPPGPSAPPSPGDGSGAPPPGADPSAAAGDPALGAILSPPNLMPPELAAPPQ